MAKNKIKNLYNLIENVAANILKSEFGMSDKQIAAEKDKIAAQAPPGVLAAMAKADALTKQSLERSAQNWRTAAAGYRAATAATKQAKDVLVPQAQNLTYLKKGLAADTAATVGKIKSGEIKPGTPEWDSMEQRTANLTSGVTPSTAPYRNPRITPSMIANLPAKDIGPMREKLKQTADEKAKMAAQAAQKAAGEKVVSTVLDGFKQYVNENTVTEESYSPMDNIKQAIKKSIVQNFMAEAKMKDGPGKTSQRPKSWNKGTKSGSEKRKMREQGKREARELNENYNWIAAAHHAFSGYISPADITVHFENKNFSSVDQFKAAVKQLADDHADKFISTQSREGQNAEKAMQNWSDKIVNKFEDKIAQQTKMKETNPLRGISKKREVSYDDTDAVRDQRAVDEFEGRRGRGSWKDYYDQPGYWRESVERPLRSRLSETKSWGPEYAGSSQDDATAAAYEQQNREKDIKTTHKTHKEMMQELSAAHEAALSHAYTAATMGKTKLTSEQMRDAYHTHFRRIMGSD